MLQQGRQPVLAAGKQLDRDFITTTRNVATCSDVASEAATGVFPSGRKQARVRLPACLVEVDTAELAADPALPDVIGAAVAGGATGVLLTSSSAGLPHPLRPACTRALDSGGE